MILAANTIKYRHCSWYIISVIIQILSFEYIVAHISISSQDAVDTTKNRMLNLALRSGSAEFSMVCGVGSCPTANCSVQWFHVSVTSEEPKNIYNGYEIASGFALFHVNPDPWHLRSSRLRISDAGKYKCEVSYQKKRLEYFAELIVLGIVCSNLDNVSKFGYCTREALMF